MGRFFKKTPMVGDPLGETRSKAFAQWLADLGVEVQEVSGMAGRPTQWVFPGWVDAIEKRLTMLGSARCQHLARVAIALAVKDQSFRRELDTIMRSTDDPYALRNYVEAVALEARTIDFDGDRVEVRNVVRRLGGE